MKRIIHRLRRSKTARSELGIHRVLVLGAGASRAQWLSEQAYAGGRDLPPPPLNNDFFAVARTLDPDWTDSTLEAIHFASGQHGALNAPSPDLMLEDAFHFVFERALDHPDDGNARLLYTNFMAFIVSMIARTTNDLCQSATGPIGELLFHSVPSSRVRRLSIVTFNYDLLVEKTLLALWKDRDLLTNWKRDPARAWSSPIQYGDRVAWPSLYLVPFINALNPNNPLLGSGRDEQLIAVHRPHGSLNWMIPAAFAIRLSRSEEAKFGDLRLFASFEIPLDEHFRFEQSAYGSDLLNPSFPFIIPPTRAKEKIQLAWLQWQDAAVTRALAAAEEVVIFGYSFPSADPMAEAIVRALEAGSHAQVGKRIGVIDPSGRVAHLLQTRIPSARITHAESVRELWSKEFGHHEPR